MRHPEGQLPHVAERILDADHEAAEAVFISCTNPPTYDGIAPLENAIDKPVLTANQLTMWARLNRMGSPIVGPGRWLREVSSLLE